MATPQFNFRLPTEQADSLRLMAKIYGASTPAAFLREMIGAMCSADVEKVKGFVARIVQKSGEQLTLQLNASLDAVAGAQKPAQEPRKERARRRGRGRGRRAS